VKIIFGVLASMYVFAIGGYLVFGSHETEAGAHSPATEHAAPQIQSKFAVDDAGLSSHFATSTPAHGAVFPAPPINVVVDFYTGLLPASSMTVTRDSQEYSTGSLEIDNFNLSMRRSFDPDAPDGVYTVAYTACSPDGLCEDGSFQFVIDRSAGHSFVDHRSDSQVTINIEKAKFSPPLIRVAPNTTVIWNNTDTKNHFVYSDAPASHTYFLPHNSPELKPSDKYLTEFTKPGAYPYHSSADPEQMIGMIIVEAITSQTNLSPDEH
jgi:plastocyanin/methionine-rich copper-binding protein CopC